MNAQVKLIYQYQIPTDFLSLYRIIFCLFQMFIIGISDVSMLYQNPNLVFNPPSLSPINVLFDEFPSFLFLSSLSVLLQFLYILLLFGYRTKIVSVLVSLVSLLVLNLAYSFGKIDHNIVIVLIPLALSVSGWGNKYSIDERQGRKENSENGFSVLLVAYILAFGMFTAGILKVATGWLDINIHGVQKHIYHYLVFNENKSFYFLFKYQHSFLWEILDFIIILFELGFVFALARLKIFRFLCGFAVLFHMTTYLTMGIGFFGHLIVYLLFVDYRKNPFLALQNSSVLSSFFTLRNLIYISAIVIVVDIYYLYSYSHLAILAMLQHFSSLVTAVFCFIIVGGIMLLQILPQDFKYYRKSID